MAKLLVLESSGHDYSKELQQEGHEVVVAFDLKEAAKQFHRDPASIDVVVVGEGNADSFRSVASEAVIYEIGSRGVPGFKSYWDMMVHKRIAEEIKLHHKTSDSGRIYRGLAIWPPY